MTTIGRHIKSNRPTNIILCVYVSAIIWKYSRLNDNILLFLNVTHVYGGGRPKSIETKFKFILGSIIII